MYSFISRNIAKPTLKELESVPKEILQSIMNKNMNLCKYIHKDWEKLSHFNKEKIFLHTVAKQFAPNDKKVLLGRWGHYQYKQKLNNYPW